MPGRFSIRFELATIEAKRENFRAAFLDFDFNHIVRFRFTDADIERLVQGPWHRAPPREDRAVVNNARGVGELVKQEGSLAASVWRFESKGVRAFASADGVGVGLRGALGRRRIR
ncbi:DNA-3-methyladenine glycosylase I [Rhizobium phaseoli]|uniref:DNA-3-methyladenine glycosylase I n=1 Tax=Rhizobium phaseoli TaxID=396 RepID=UPI00062EF861|nr:hypothetical protein RPHASCH2410_PD04415 [Rhizobium phaseoli Ch24-10]